MYLLVRHWLLIGSGRTVLRLLMMSVLVVIGAIVLGRYLCLALRRGVHVTVTSAHLIVVIVTPVVVTFLLHLPAFNIFLI